MSRQMAFKPNQAYVNALSDYIRETSENYGVSMMEAAAVLRALSNDLMQHVGGSIESIEVVPLSAHDGHEQEQADDN